MNNITPFVTVIVPCRNEEKYIKKLLQNILEQDYPQAMLEVYIVDGESDDRTLSIIEGVKAGNNHIYTLNNPDKIVPHAMNMAIRKCKGEVIVRMDAHSEYPLNYISTLVQSLNNYKADNVGGVWITKPGNSSREAEAISISMSHPFGIGNAMYRIGMKEPAWTDTVPYGCYRREVFDKIGFFDEQLIRNQDDEFNGRLIKNGGRILLLPEIEIIYYARENIKKMSIMFYQYGLFKPLVNIKLGKPDTIRQLFPPALVLSLFVLMIGAVANYYLRILFIVEIVLYLSLNFIFSLKLSGPKHLFFQLFKIFPSIHFSYGWGYLSGLIRFSILKKHNKRTIIANPSR